jgi:phospholipase/carboxylesterase
VAPVLAGVPLDIARTAALLVHGRDQDEREMLEVAARVGLPDVAYVLPVAAGRTWYPGRYFDPPSVNQPWLERALDVCDAAILTGTLLGPAGERVGPAGVDGLPMFLCASRHDDWIALDDALATARAFEAAGTNVTFETYEDRAHHINDRAIEGFRRLLRN